MTSRFRSPARITSAIDAPQLASIETTLKQAGVAFTRVELDHGNVIVRFADNDAQLKGRDFVKDEKTGLNKTYVNAMMYASRAPRWIQALGLRAMPLGLDLRGGLYLLFQVDVDGAVAKLLSTYDQDLRRALDTEKITSRISPRCRKIPIFPTGCACCCLRARISGRCVPPSRKCSPISAAATPRWRRAPRWIA
jgi:preprotein translocase subunit SecD